MLEEFVVPQLYEMDLRDVWFQQDGATAHTARASMALLWEHFPGRLICLRSDLEWPPLTGFDPMRLLFVGLSEVPVLQQPSTDS